MIRLRNLLHRRPLFRFLHRAARPAQLEHSDFRPAPMVAALAVAEAAVHIEMAAFDGVVAVDVMTIAVRVKPLAQAAGRDLRGRACGR